MDALVTGGAGFIGSHLVERLLGAGARVRVLDHLTLAGGSPANLGAVRDDVEVVRADVRDEAAVRRAATGCEVIFHQAAEISVPRSIADPVATYAVNVMGTLNVLLAARRRLPARRRCLVQRRLRRVAGAAQARADAAGAGFALRGVEAGRRRALRPL